MNSETGKLNENTKAENILQTTHSNADRENSNVEEKTNTEETSCSTPINSMDQLTGVNTEDRERAVKQTAGSGNTFKPRVKQNLRSIHVEPVFEAGDVKEISLDDADDQEEVIDEDDSEDELNDDAENEMINDDDVNTKGCADGKRTQDEDEWEDAVDEKLDIKKHSGTTPLAVSNSPVSAGNTWSRSTKHCLRQSDTSQLCNREQSRASKPEGGVCELSNSQSSSKIYSTEKHTSILQNKQKALKSSSVEDRNLKGKKKPKMRVKNLKTLRLSQKKINFKPDKRNTGDTKSCVTPSASVKESPGGKWMVTPLKSARSRSCSEERATAKLQKTGMDYC